MRNFDLDPIDYHHAGKDRKYYPDFILDNKFIVEIKWLGFIYQKKKGEIESKKEALSLWCKDKEYLPLFMTNKTIHKRLVKKAIKLHERLKYR